MKKYRRGLNRYHSDIQELIRDGHGTTVIARWITSMKKYGVTSKEVSAYCIEHFGSVPKETMSPMDPGTVYKITTNPGKKNHVS